MVSLELGRKLFAVSTVLQTNTAETYIALLPALTQLPVALSENSDLAVTGSAKPASLPCVV